MYKYIILGILTFSLIYDLVTSLLSDKQKNKPLPENVRDVYDEAEYKRWRAYSAEHKRLSMYEKLFSFVLLAVLFATNVFAAVYNVMPGGELVKCLLLMVLYSLFITVISIPFGYIGTFRIEEKYGFNKSTKKTFVTDEIKNFILNSVINCLLLAVAYLLCRNMTLADYFIFLGAMCLFMLLLSLLSNLLQKLFNKFTSLEEGELRTTLTEMFESEGYTLKDIYVMDASRSTTKVNAYCSGLGRLKKIVLFDNLVNNYTPDEIAAVFAHELAHFKHRDTAKLTACSFVNAIIIVSLLSAFALVPEISVEYGFDGANMAFAMIAMMSVLLQPIMTLVALPINAFSRHCERRADTFAVQKGYGESMISALKKLSKDNLTDLNPHPFIVKAEHSHPTLSQRITLVTEKMGKTE